MMINTNINDKSKRNNQFHWLKAKIPPITGPKTAPVLV